MIEFRHLRNFTVLAREGNYQKAAQRLNLAQPSLSRSIQRLEGLLGTELLIRGHQAMSLTASGELVLNHSESIIQGVDTLRKELQYLQGKSSGHLAIGTSPVPANTILGPAIGRFIDRYPDVHVELEEGTWQNNLVKLLQGKLSLLITDVRGEEIGHEALVQCFNLPTYNAVFCARKNHPLAERDSLSLEDLRQYPIAIPRNLPAGVVELFGDLLFEYRSDFAGLLHYDAFPPINAAMQHSQMLALTPQVALLDETVADELHTFKPVDMPKLDVCFSVVMLRSQASVAAKRFLQLMLSNSKA
ncbi:LysR family transcriptional regulator [Shewanella schlegeliana]|uniref:LysR family transcriptional regulator n=1 Tax=Shewanella schlegeliana TaxID=190308 RepID=UPI001C7D2481|nr:LysR family transcriptional regulator [Shewanella schlegeliana]